LAYVLIALVLERGRRAVVRPVSKQLLIDIRDLLQVVVGLLYIVGNSLVGLTAKRLDAGGRAVELLRQGLRAADGLVLGRERIRACRQGLHGVGEIIERRIERGIRTGLAVNLLQLLVEIGSQIGIGAAAAFSPQLLLDEGIEQPVDRRSAHAAGAVTGYRLDRGDLSGDIARGLRIGDVAGDDR